MFFSLALDDQELSSFAWYTLNKIWGHKKWIMFRKWPEIVGSKDKFTISGRSSIQPSCPLLVADVPHPPFVCPAPSPSLTPSLLLALPPPTLSLSLPASHPLLTKVGVCWQRNTSAVPSRKVAPSSTRRLWANTRTWWTCGEAGASSRSCWPSWTLLRSCTAAPSPTWPHDTS